MTPEKSLARQALTAAAGCARRLERSRRVLSSQFPATAAGLASLPPEGEDAVDAFLKRFEQLVTILQDDLFKAIAAIGEEDIRALSRREITELMERLGALPSASMFRMLVAIRHRVAHMYPDDPDRQARNINDAYAAVGDLLAAHEAVARYVERRMA